MLVLFCQFTVIQCSSASTVNVPFVVKCMRTMEPNSQYDFITNPSPPPQKSPLGGAGLSKKKLALFAGGGALLLIIIISVAASMFSGGPTNTDHLLAVAAQQNEIIRVSDVAIKDAKGIEARNLAMTTKLSLRSDQSSLTAALKAQKVKVPKAEKNAKTDQMLTEATQNNRFDEVYLKFIQAELVDYQKKLNTAYKTTISKSLKDTLRTQYENASILIGVDPEL